MEKKKDMSSEVFKIRKANLWFRQASAVSPWSRGKKQQSSFTATQSICKTCETASFQYTDYLAAGS